MKIVGIYIANVTHNQATVFLAKSVDLQFLPWLQRGTAEQVLDFFVKTVSERVPERERTSIQHENSYLAHANRRDDVVGIVVTDLEYEARAAHSLIGKLLDDFTSKIPRAVWQEKARLARSGVGAGEDKLAKTDVGFTSETGEFLRKYQDPKDADPIMKLQKELDDTKMVLHKTIDSVLQRGEKLDDLMERSNALSQQSKMFYTQAKKQNSCCIIV